jgi:hypothetical protein
MSTDSFTTLSLVTGGMKRGKYSLLIHIWHRTVTSAIADFVLAILPWHILWGLQMKKKDKIFIASSMSLGLL